MVTLNYSFELDCDERNFFKILTDYKNLPKYLPRQLKKIEILDEHGSYTTIEATASFKTLIKKEFSHKIIIEKKSEYDISAKILDGFAKGTSVTISILIEKEKTLCNINSEIKLSLKTVILYPIIKREYNSLITGVFRRISIDAKPAKVQV